MKAQITFELLVSFIVVVAFALLIAVAVQQYSHFVASNENQLSNSIATVSNLIRTAPIIIHYN